MVIGICRIDLILHGNNSLKGKRQVVKSLKDKVSGKFNVSIAEVDELDKWGRAIIGISVVGNDRTYVNSVLDNVVNFIEGLHTAQLGNHEIEIINI